MKLVDFRHVAEQDVLLAEQGAGDEVSHGWVVHLCRIALQCDITYNTFRLENQMKGTPVDQLEERAPHVQRLCPCCSDRGFDSTLWPFAARHDLLTLAPAD